MEMKKLLLAGALILGVSSLAGCSSMNNSFNKMKAGTTSSDYVVIKYNLKGEPTRYWILRDNFVNNEESSDGYYWSDSHGGINRVTNADAMDIKGEADEQAIATYHLEKAMRIND
jgi:hypothetical protein